MRAFTEGEIGERGGNQWVLNIRLTTTRHTREISNWHFETRSKKNNNNYNIIERFVCVSTNHQVGRS